MRTLPPQPLRDNYWLDVESQLKAIFYEIVFAPLMGTLKATTQQAKGNVLTSEVRNAGGTYVALTNAIKSGRVQYVEGVFSGEFNVSITKDLKAIGAKYDMRSKTYRADVQQVPASIRAEAANYNMDARKTHDELQRQLNDIELNLTRKMDQVNIDADGTIRAIEKGWKQSAKILEVQPVLTPEATERLAEDYNKNLKIYVKDFSQQAITTLRKDVEANATEGYRFDKLIETIRHRYGVSANKAKFLARQETSLFMSKYRKARFGQAGVRRYKWSTAHDERVRDSHKRLNGQVFSYDSPPITNRDTGQRNNPGEDFNCRCLDIPILERDPAMVR